MKSISLWIGLLGMFCLPTNAQDGEAANYSNEGAIENQTIDRLNNNNADVNNKPNTFAKESINALDAQYQNLLETLKTEDAFSLKLAESYMEYGGLLSKFQRYDEANKVFTEALHILKVNYGIYSYEQISALRALVYVAIGDNQSQDLVAHLNRIGNIIRKNSGSYDDQLDTMFLHAGYYYIDLFSKARIGNLKRFEHLVNARRIFSRVLEHNKKELLSSNRLPYGELLLVSYLETTLVEKLPSVFQRDRENDIRSFTTASDRARVPVSNDAQYLHGSFKRTLRYADEYLFRARLEKNETHINQALLAQADINTLFGRKNEAEELYKVVWEQMLESEITERTAINDINQPVRIPDFEYIGDYDFNKINQKTISVPLSFAVSDIGRISKIKSLALDENKQAYYSKAKRELRKMVFRPAIIDGEAANIEQFTYSVSVLEK